MDELGTCLKSGVCENILSTGAVIDGTGIHFRNSFIRKIGCDNCVSFLTDMWVDTGPPLMTRFPRLFALDCLKDCRLMDRSQFIGSAWVGSWNWRCQPRGRSLPGLHSLLALREGTFLRPVIEDSWSWVLDHDGIFSVNHLSKLIDAAYLSDCFLGKTHDWNTLIPKKINIFIWRPFLSRIPLLTN
ncbi:RNA-directed DNA polymerase, eukaryota [Artemisia annua]|uniref:RNA-directed DNA polymerase, eukaryota n=1 Tax=Artemisia annua TaxID=35608 RepID=A0A2U1LJS2_ARTAN|nr:RNA-directed DNA polymerase, eukaryota [Artemisia annua]